ncbi:GH92 family glycosyl hydrolase [Marinifilum caeruleilacunae]|uniref:Glycoside hydrolase family 92 protein n=1 Tax=Marinifilum caeruleilacunae TaxID=2499076 RepID=A0ABX1WVD2_9BACT|nr:GH92 family glycosyl hydrolase [Marinifilum caeruleilacunae]NOU59869.1 glycoside hydrolase family 92 protein [Marinifilum caeruleilacunae]
MINFLRTNICSNISTNKIKVFLISGLMILTLSCESQIEPIELVNPNIGTAHSRWFFYTPAALPFGMAKPAPSTNGHYGNKWGWEAVGYDDRHTSIEGFVNAHEFQIGGISLMPTCGVLKTIPGKLDNPEEGYRSRFSKENEIAKPGYYSVVLDDYQVKVELTASKRVAFHRYTFPEKTDAHLIFDIGRRQGESGAVIDAMVNWTSANTIEGWVRTEPEYVKKYQKGAYIDIFFSAKINKEIKDHGVFRNDSIMVNANQLSGIGSGAYASFKTKESEVVEVQVALSYTSIDNARESLEAESTSFDKARKSAEEIWNHELSKIQVRGGSHQDQIKFYTGLYHALLGRGLASDANGAYPKNDGSIGQIPLDKDGKPQFNFYNTDAVWGAFWNLSQLWTLAWPEYYNDFVQSHLLVYQDTGWLGDGLANSRYVSGVGTNFVGLIIASAYNCGIRNHDIDLAFEAALKNELEWNNRPYGAGKLDVKSFVELGFIPHQEEWADIPEANAFSASHVLEYSFSAHAVANFAKALGKESEHKQLEQLSHGWKKIFNPATGFIHPKDAGGKFISNFDPMQAWRGFQEGNSWQYSFYVPHDIEELVEKIGEIEFNQRLDSIFLSSREMAFGGGKEIDAFAGVETLYNHGNQPSLHIPWLYNFSGQPEKSQYWTRMICNEFYGTDPIHGYGYGQDEDQGQLGAWFVMASIGLFDVAGLTHENPSMQIGSPAFDEINIHLNQDYYPGKKIQIRQTNHSAENLLVESVKLNGKPFSKLSIPFQDLVKGASLEIRKKSKK